MENCKYLGTLLCCTKATPVFKRRIKKFIEMWLPRLSASLPVSVWLGSAVVINRCAHAQVDLETVRMKNDLATGGHKAAYRCPLLWGYQEDFY